MKPGWEMVIGLEVHCELKTATKLFCGCRNAFGDEPNTNVCPVCLGLPGSLPVLNQRAVELAMAIGTALHCEIRPSTFHRKNYFYPDQAKDYQISQYDEPINVDGLLELPDGTRVGIERAHMEEDTGKTTHAGASGRIHGADYSLVDYNRAGVPLVEIVSRARHPLGGPGPGLRHRAAGHPGGLGCLGRQDGGGLDAGRRQRLGATVGRRPVRHPLRDQEPELGALAGPGHRVRGRPPDRPASSRASRWSSRPATGTRTPGRTVTLRSKEEAYDYRYFLEPDLVPLVPDAEWIRAVADTMGPMPADRRARLAELLGDGDRSRDAQADQIATVVDLGLDDLVTAAVAARGGRGPGPGPHGQRGRHRRRAARGLDPSVLRGPADHGGRRDR